MVKTTTRKPARGKAALQADCVPCRAPDREEPRLVEAWKFERIRAAILSVVPDNDIGIMYKQLTSMVRANLSSEERTRIGKLHWHTTTVKLELELRGEVVRIEGARPQYLRRPRSL